MEDGARPDVGDKCVAERHARRIEEAVGCVWGGTAPDASNIMLEPDAGTMVIVFDATDCRSAKGALFGIRLVDALFSYSSQFSDRPQR